MTAGNRRTGFTLIELLVTIAVIIIFATIAVPGFRTMVADNRLTADFNQVLTGLHFARSEAAKRREPVSVEVSGSWLMVIEDGDGNELRRLASEDDRVSIDPDPFTVNFNELGRSPGCSPCSLTMSYAGSETVEVGVTGNISRP